MSFNNLIKWSEQFSYLPWRAKRTLYRTLISEIMLQQTTVPTVLKKFGPFINEFPNIQSLANSTEEEIVMAWKGLGYYRRAKNLRLMAIELSEKYNSKIPSKKEDLLMIKGIGEYTASAITAIGRDQHDLAIDANIERVLARYLGIKEEKIILLKKKIRYEFENNKIFSPSKIKNFREFNEALMDLGREVCKAKSTKCFECPLKSKCSAFKLNTPLDFPKVKEKKIEKHRVQLLRIIHIQKNKIWAYKKSNKEWLAGQFELPTFTLDRIDKIEQQYPYLKEIIPSKLTLKSFKSTITKYQFSNYIVEFKHLPLKLQKTIAEEGSYSWIEMDLKKVNWSTSSLKALNLHLTKS